MRKKFSKEESINVLSIGANILVKDVMDLYLRGLGEVKTFSASKLSTAVETYQLKHPSVIFCEHSFPEGSAAEFVEMIGGLSLSNNCYFVLAAEKSSDELVALGTELGIDEILVQPFAVDAVNHLMDNFIDKKARPEEEWVTEVCIAKTAFVEKRFQEAEDLYAAAVRKHWKNSSVVLEGANFFLIRNQPQKGLPLVEKVLTESPESARALHLHGCILRRMGKFEEAVRQLTHAAKISPLNTARNVELAETFIAMSEEQINNALRAQFESSSLLMRKVQYMMYRKEYGPLVTFIDSKRNFLSDSARREADNIATLAKKLGGLK